MPYVNKKESEKKVSGRPKKEISQKQFEEMCKVQCTENEICAILGIGIDKLLSWCLETYDDTFSNVYKKFSENGKMSLRRAQMRLAQTNASMAIWLGKNMLGQTDKVDVALKEEDDDPITKAIKESLNGKQTDKQ
jgi:DNA-directed RNA polymerase specialized sigma subunit